MATRRRILKELDDMSRDTSSGMMAEPVSAADFTHLRGSFAGPPDTPYAGGTFLIDIALPDNYPFVPPRMKFETRVWHPNISSQTGAICLDTLRDKWSPVLTIKTALLSLQSLLAAPEPNDPQDAEVARMMLSDRAAFDTKARQWARQYAGAGGPASQLPPPPPDRLDGYDPQLVREFENMGFGVEQVVGTLRKVGVRRGELVGEMEKGRVVEALLGG